MQTEPAAQLLSDWPWGVLSDMVRINLLPAEIVERRKYERFYPYVFVVAVILLAIIVVTAGVLYIFETQRSAQLQQSRETVAGLKRDAEALSIFEDQQRSFQARQDIAVQALDERVDMGKLMEELSLVLPDAIWVDGISLNEENGLTLHGYTPDSEKGALDSSYKSVAGVLVRINSLDGFEDVWLSNASSSKYSAFEGSAEGEAKVVGFEVSGKIVTESKLAQDDADAAPPAPETE